MENFIVSARKYRPSTFGSVVGQKSLVTTLKNAIKSNHLAHAYLFCGPRGVGKTTCARIFAKTINCEHLTSDFEACNECESCVSFNEQRSLNIHELDAASNNSTDDIKYLIEQVRIPPQIGKYSVYIVDEVHMLYDRQHLQPLFQLQIGNPGSSFAVEIARKIGLPEDLITEAAEKVGSEHLDYDKHLQDIVRDKRYWENKRQQIRLKEKKLEETLAKYEAEMDDMNRQKREIVQKAKTEAQNILNESNAKIENTIRQIKEAQAEKEKTKQIRKELDDFRKKAVAPVPTEKEQPKHSHQKKKTGTTNAVPTEILQVGSSVRLKGQTATGNILELQDKQAVVAFGQLKSTVKLSKLETVSNNQLKKEKHRFESLGQASNDDVRQRKLVFKSDIDVRGMSSTEQMDTPALPTSPTTRS